MFSQCILKARHSQGIYSLVINLIFTLETWQKRDSESKITAELTGISAQTVWQSPGSSPSLSHRCFLSIVQIKYKYKTSIWSHLVIFYILFFIILMNNCEWKKNSLKFFEELLHVLSHLGLLHCIKCINFFISGKASAWFRLTCLTLNIMVGT